jgi:hypothetical protein
MAKPLRTILAAAERRAHPIYTDDFAVALHEAAHVLIGVASGVELRQVDLLQTEDRDGQAVFHPIDD